MVKLYTNKTWLKRRYVDQGKTVEEIADEAGVGKSTIDRYIAKFNLQRERRSW